MPSPQTVALGELPEDLQGTAGPTDATTWPAKSMSENETMEVAEVEVVAAKDVDCEYEGVERPSAMCHVSSRVSGMSVISVKSSEEIWLLTATQEQLQDLYPMMCWCNSDCQGKLRKTCKGWPEGHRGKLLRYNKWMWAFPKFGWTAMKYMKVGYMKKFYIDDYPQASLGIIAFSSVVAVLIDAFTDPKMAVWTDNLRTRWGRRRPFVFASAFFVPAVCILSWCPLMVPSGLGASIWFGVFHVGFQLADTLYNTPMEAWGAQLTPNAKERTATWLANDVCGNTGILFGMAIVPLLFLNEGCMSTPDTGCAALPGMSAGFGLIFMTFMLILAYFGKEPLQTLVINVAEEKKKIFKEEDVVPMLISTYLMKPFRVLLLTAITKAMGQEIPFTILPFMSQWVFGSKFLKAGKLFGYLVVANLVFGLLSMPIWMMLVRRTSKYQAFVCFNLVLAISSILYIIPTFDGGGIEALMPLMAVTALFGFAYGGTFILKDMITGLIDYDELLTGGKRREASYLMCVEFVPKFMSIPGACIPFLVMAYFDYTRPLPAESRISCGDDFDLPSQFSDWDAYCMNYYRWNTTAGLCSDKVSCQTLINQGVTFVCENAFDECGLRQNDDVRFSLRIFFSLVPGFFILLGLLGLAFYPKAARSEEKHQEVLWAVTALKNGEMVEDPWVPGSIISPAEGPTPNAGALSYLTPSELRRIALASPRGDGEGEDAAAKVSGVITTVTLWALIFAAMLPTGLYIVAAGFQDLGTDLGASVSPLGLMVVGIGIQGLWFNMTRLSALFHLKKIAVPRSEVVDKFNRLTLFTHYEPLS